MAPDPYTHVLPALALSVVAVVLIVVYLRVRGRRSSQEDSREHSKPTKFDTTLGEFRDMREALRPLASRVPPQSPAKANSRQRPLSS